MQCCISIFKLRKWYIGSEDARLGLFYNKQCSYHNKFLKLNSDENADEGELSRIVITDLFNFTTPIISCDIGDLALIEKNEGYGPLIKTIGG